MASRWQEEQQGRTGQLTNLAGRWGACPAASHCTPEAGAPSSRCLANCSWTSLRALKLKAGRDPQGLRFCWQLLEDSPRD